MLHFILAYLYACLCSFALLSEFNLTVVRDVSGSVAWAGVELDVRQMNTALLLHTSVSGASVVESVTAHVRQLEQEAETLLLDVSDAERMRYRAAHRTLVGDVAEWVLPPPNLTRAMDRRTIQ